MSQKPSSCQTRKYFPELRFVFLFSLSPTCLHIMVGRKVQYLKSESHYGYCDVNDSANTFNPLEGCNALPGFSLDKCCPFFSDPLIVFKIFTAHHGVLLMWTVTECDMMGFFTLQSSLCWWEQFQINCVTVHKTLWNKIFWYITCLEILFGWGFFCWLVGFLYRVQEYILFNTNSKWGNKCRPKAT